VDRSGAFGVFCLLMILILLMGYFGAESGANFFPASGWRKASFMLALAVAAIAAVWLILRTENWNIGKGIAAVVLLVLFAAACFFIFSRLLPKWATAVGGERVALSAQISRELKYCRYSAKVALVTADNPSGEKSIAEKLETIRTESPHSSAARYAIPLSETDWGLFADIPAASLRDAFCVTSYTYRRLPKGQFSAVLHGRQSAFGLLIQKMEVKK
jgi:Zn-dependent protease with chaperone function